MFHSVESHTQAKADRNEDHFLILPRALVVADGATDKSGQLYDGLTPGEFAAQAVARASVLAGMYRKSPVGIDFVDFANGYISGQAKQFGVDLKRQPKTHRPIAAFVSVVPMLDDIVVTQVGNVSFRINGVPYENPSPVERHAIEKRAAFFDAHLRDPKYSTESWDQGDSGFNEFMADARAHIMPELLAQYDALNNPDHPEAFYALDGVETPGQGVRVFRFPQREVSTIEIWTDGHAKTPKYSRSMTCADWEQAYRVQQKLDPWRIGEFAATKSSDDRTVVVARR